MALTKLATTIVLISIVAYGSAIKCYSCSTMEEPSKKLSRDSNPFINVTVPTDECDTFSEDVLKECPEGTTGCIIIRQDYDSPDETYTMSVHDCATDLTPEICDTVGKSIKFDATCYSCKEDGCNSGVGLTSNLMLTLISLGIFNLISKLF